jgi:hypothetical protein
MSSAMCRLQVFSLAALTLMAGAAGARAQDTPQTPLPSVMQAPVEKSREAIAECRARRLRKELSNYKESAECSNPQIFAAWKAANYPDMDLITEWLDARERASEQVDQKTLTPKQFEREMDDLTVRLTAEERRRRAGLVYSAENTLMLRLPPSSQVLGVVAHDTKTRQAARLSAAARARAANGVYVDPNAGTTVGSMGALTPLDSAREKPGVGGPFIPVDPNSPAARAAMARAAAQATGEGAGGLYALLASQPSEADAHAAFEALQAQYPQILGERDAVIRRTDFGAQGVYYRVEIGPLNAAQADELCGSLKEAGAQCAPRFE